MAMDPESRKKIQIFLLLAIMVAGGRAAYIVYSRYQDRKEAEKPKREVPLNADNYVRPRKLRLQLHLLSLQPGAAQNRLWA